MAIGGGALLGTSFCLRPFEHSVVNFIVIFASTLLSLAQVVLFRQVQPNPRGAQQANEFVTRVTT